MTVIFMLMVLVMTQMPFVCCLNKPDEEFVDLQKQYNNILEKLATLEQQLAHNLLGEHKLKEEIEKSHKHEDQLIEIVSFQSKMLQMILDNIAPNLEHQSARNYALTPKQQLPIALHWFETGAQFHAIGDMHWVSKASVCCAVRGVINGGMLEENKALKNELLELYQKKDFKSNYTNNTNCEASPELHRSWFPTGPVIDGAWMFAAVANITQYTGTPVGRNYQTKQATMKLIQDLSNTKDFLCHGSTQVPEILRQNHRTTSSMSWLQQPAVLVESVKSGAEFATRLLLLLGANPMVRQPKDPLLNPTALHWSAARGKANLTAALIHAGAMVDARDKHNQTALHWAAGNGQLEVTKVLLDNGASRNAVTDSSWTPLHYAALKGHKEEAKLLLKGAIDVSALLAIRNDQGKTAREVALSFGWKELADWLLSQEQLQHQAA